jgi:hypothetical protein
MRKIQFFNENMLRKILGFGCMHENKFFFFLKGKINLRVFEIFFKNVLNFFKKIFQRKPGILILNLYFTV